MRSPPLPLKHRVDFGNLVGGWTTKWKNSTSKGSEVRSPWGFDLTVKNRKFHPRFLGYPVVSSLTLLQYDSLSKLAYPGQFHSTWFCQCKYSIPRSLSQTHTYLPTPCTHKHTHTYARTHTHTHTHTQICVQFCDSWGIRLWYTHLDAHLWMVCNHIFLPSPSSQTQSTTFSLEMFSIVKWQSSFVLSWPLYVVVVTFISLTDMDPLSPPSK
jgi:hypothetical protein